MTTATSLRSPLLVGSSTFAQNAREQLQGVSQTGQSLLIVGPAGSGKESLARAAHAASPRRDQPFIPLNCKRLTGGMLFDSQVFGHLPGAFAGLKTSSLGLIQAANGGTLFLDDIDNLSVEAQRKLLRTLREQLVVPMGGVEGLPVNVRVIASTTIDLQLAVSAGQFDSELYQLLSASAVELPPLAERLEDVAAIAERVIAEITATSGKSEKRFSDSAIAWIRSYHWPGNVRELCTAVELLAGGNESTIDARAMRRVMTRVNRPAAGFQRQAMPMRFAGFAALRATRIRSCMAMS